MTLTELKYIVAVAREKHFGKAAEACFVSQPTLSVAVKKLEDELEVKLFERSAGDVSVTPLGEEIVRQAQSVLEQAAEPFGEGAGRRHHRIGERDRAERRRQVDHGTASSKGKTGPSQHTRRDSRAPSGVTKSRTQAKHMPRPQAMWLSSATSPAKPCSRDRRCATSSRREEPQV